MAAQEALMSPALVALVLLAALLHASWNALQKSAADPEWAKVLYGPASVLMMAPLTLLVPFPQAQVWPWLLGASLFIMAGAALRRPRSGRPSATRRRLPASIAR